MSPASKVTNNPAFRAVRPPTGGFWFNWQVARDFRNSIPHPTSPNSPMIYVVDLDAVHPTVEVVEEALVPLGEAVKRGDFGKSAIVVSTRNKAVRAYIQLIASQLSLPIFVSLSTTPFEVAEAETAAPLSPTDDQTLSAVAALGGKAGASEVASHLGLRHTAATNRLVGLAQRGYLHRQKRAGRAGDLFVDPRLPSFDQSTKAVMGEVGRTVSEPELARVRKSLKRAVKKPARHRS